MEPVQILKPRNPGESLKVAETILKKRNHDIKGMAARAQKRLELKKSAGQSKISVGVLTPEKLVKNARVRLSDSKRYKNQLAKPRVSFGDRFATIFVVRNSRSPVSKGSQAILKSMGITQRYSATFVPNTSAGLTLLRSVQPFVFYGFLNTDIARDVMMKKLRFKTTTSTNDDNDETMIDSNHESKESECLVVDNAMIEDRLGHLGMLCIEDIIAEIKECGVNFYNVMSHLSAFRLGDIKKAEGVDANILESGDLRLKINDKVSKLL